MKADWMWTGQLYFKDAHAFFFHSAPLATWLPCPLNQLRRGNKDVSYHSTSCDYLSLPFWNWVLIFDTSYKNMALCSKLHSILSIKEAGWINAHNKSSSLQCTQNNSPLINPLTLRLLMSYIYMKRIFLMFLDHTRWRTTVGMTPLDEWSARRRDLYLTTHDTHNRKISMTPVGFEPTISDRYIYIYIYMTLVA